MALEHDSTGGAQPAQPASSSPFLASHLAAFLGAMGISPCRNLPESLLGASASTHWPREAAGQDGQGGLFLSTWGGH